ncbi:MAG: class I SAM-dependent methyltransferase [Anaerolineales bacterium]|nr:class I SAM-dependent methyltransferase [Chloroflexota bacterium]MBL6981645.1 class I SAM-dependent methyltransferase [Anaerolineales bacterium]
MSLVFRCGEKSIELALERMRSDGLVSDDAWFNFNAPDRLRSEVAYRDFDFLTRLCRVGDAETSRAILECLKQNEIVSKDLSFDEEVFEAFQKEVKQKFKIPGTSITPVMERLLFLLSALKRPQRAIGLGTYHGYALVWAVGASCGAQPAYGAEKFYAIDIDPDVTQSALENFAQLEHTDHIEFIAGDGLDIVEQLDGPFDYIYLDVDSRELGKGIYLDLLQGLYDKLEVGGWALAHDTCVPPFADQLEGYLAFVRDQDNFSQSISFDIDPFGLELSIK